MNKKSKFKQYRIIWLTLPYNIGAGKSVKDIIQGSELWNLFTDEQRKELKKDTTLSELTIYGLTDLMNFYCNKYNYSIVSISATQNGYYLITLIKD